MNELDNESDSIAALDFLRQVHPNGPWVLTSIHPDRKKISTRTFGPESDAECLDWIKQHNGTSNLYWMVNVPSRPLTLKARREDVDRMVYLHVDLDPRAGEDIIAERERCLSLFTTALPNGVPRPSVVVDSGGGYQAFWRLLEPVQIRGELELAEDAKRYNQQLERLFGADNCHNIDRIMRLPHTLNVPDDRKRRKGRKAALARVVSIDLQVQYPITAFTAAAPVQMAGSFAGQAKSILESGNIERLRDVNDLDDFGVPERIKIAIAQGANPDEPKTGDNSRSGWVFDVACQLIRNNVPDEVIFSILTDPEFGISQSVLEKGSNAGRYALRQIERARFLAVDPRLLELNDKFAIIGNLGGKCRVVEEIVDPVLERPRLVRQTFEDFRNRHLHLRVDNGTPKGQSAGHWWLAHPSARRFDRVVFAPGREIPLSYNLWQGFAYEARPGNAHDAFLEHIHTNVCQGIESHFAYLIGWMARVVQHPGQPGEVAVVLRGGKGVGKSFVARQFGRLFGRHFLHVSNPSHLVGNFNAHLRDVILLFADEAFYAGDKKHESILKTLITEDTIQIEAKGVDVETSPNFVHLLMASNDAHVVRASGDERRFFVLDVADKQQQRATYFGAIADQLASGGYENLLHFLLTYNLDNYEVRKIPQTGALLDQKESTLEGIERLVFEMLKLGELPIKPTWVGNIQRRPFLSTSSLQAWAQSVLHRDVSEKKIGDLLAALGAEPARKDARGWILPSLPEARKGWDKARFAFSWDEAKEWHGVPEAPPSHTPF